MLVIVRGPVPELRSVEVSAALVAPTDWLPNASVVGVSVAAGAGAAPGALSATARGLAGASSEIERDALRVPVAVGAKVTVIVHDAVTASVAGAVGHVVVSA